MAVIKYTILTLQNTSERLKKTQKTLQVAGIDPGVFYGINNNRLALRRFGLSNGLIGCYISHLCMWQQDLNSQGDWFVFMEDDYAAPLSFKADIEYHLNNVPSQYDVVVLLNYNLQGQGKETKNISELFVEKTGVWSNALIAIPKRSLRKVCEVMGTSLDNHIDVELWKKHEEGKINVCYALNNIGSLHEGSNKSSIALKKVLQHNGLSIKLR